MRILTIIILFAFIYSCSEKKQKPVKTIYLTKVDSLSGLNELREFVKNADSSLIDFLCIDPNSYGNYSPNLSQLKRRLDSMFPNATFLKEDFDKNDYTDLIITGEYYQHSFNAIALMNYGNEKYSVIPLNLFETGFPIYPKLVYKNNLPAVELNAIELFPEFSENGISKKTLIYKDGVFMEYYDGLENYQISKIEFSSNGCHGSCPVFDLKIHKDSISSFRAKHYNFSRKKEINTKSEEGYFEAMINKKDYEEICEIMNYIQLKNRKDEYFSGTFHDPFCYLKVHFTDGSTKTIKDRGKIGTNGLNLLYRKLSALRFNQEWKKI
jgi:hypothetical protein